MEVFSANEKRKRTEKRFNTQEPVFLCTTAIDWLMRNVGVSRNRGFFFFCFLSLSFFLSFFLFHLFVFVCFFFAFFFEIRKKTAVEIGRTLQLQRHIFSVRDEAFEDKPHLFQFSQGRCLNLSMIWTKPCRFSFSFSFSFPVSLFFLSFFFLSFFLICDL